MNSLYILGAGFSAFANRYIQPEVDGGCKGYPLGEELGIKCFDESYDLSLGVENAFQTALGRHDFRPIDILVDTLQLADQYLGRGAALDPSSAICRFIEQRPTSTYITFNYDCLLEIALFRLNRWYPMDGFGISAKVALPPSNEAGLSRFLTLSKVLHLHGSIYFYPREFDIQQHAKNDMNLLTFKYLPELVFDPDANASLFLPFQKGVQDSRYLLPPERILAPIPDKTKGLAKRYTQSIYREATKALRTCHELIAIGYNFGETDQSSYEPLLDVFHLSAAGKKLKVVTPNASEIVYRITQKYPDFTFRYYNGTFENWVSEGYPFCE